MEEHGKATEDASDPFGWKDPPGMGRILVISSTIGVVLALVAITLGMMAAGQVWQSSLALGVFVAGWGGLGFGSMIGGVVYLTRIDEAAKALKADERAVASDPSTSASEPSRRTESHSADAA